MNTMRKAAVTVLFLLVAFHPAAEAGLFDMLKERIGLSSEPTLEEGTVVSGLKEALSVGTRNAVASVSEVDGYFGNELIKIVMPEKIQMVTNVLAKAGYGQQVDAFILSMNRAAETAAPKAASIFVSAIKEMTLEDATGILNGGDTAATDYFREKTSPRIYEAFEPIVSSSMNEVGVTRTYKEMMDRYTSLPFTTLQSLDLDDYVTDRALDGLFHMLSQEEMRIRTDPAARVSELLKKVFADAGQDR